MLVTLTGMTCLMQADRHTDIHTDRQHKVLTLNKLDIKVYLVLF